MIAKLKGVIDNIGEDCCIIDVNGVGYLVNMSSRSLAKLKQGDYANLLIETVIKEFEQLYVSDFFFKFCI